MSIEIKSDILAKELNQGIVPLGVPKAYQYDAALVEAARAAVNQGIDDVAEAGATAKAAIETQETASVNAVSAQEQASKADVNALGDLILNQMKHGYGYPFTAATAAAMADTTKIYVYTGSESGYTNGNWYYHNGTAWVSGGVYNATALETDKTLMVSGAAADAKIAGYGLINFGDATFSSCDDVTRNSVYFVSSGGGVPVVSDFPFRAAGWLVTYTTRTNNISFQFAYPYEQNDKIKYRSKTFSGWGEWHYITPDDVLKIGNELTSPSLCSEQKDLGVYFINSGYTPSDYAFQNPGWLISMPTKNKSQVLQLAFDWYGSKPAMVRVGHHLNSGSASWSEWKLFNSNALTNYGDGRQSSCDDILTNSIYFVSAAGGVTEIPDFPSNGLPGWLVTYTASSTNNMIQFAYPWSQSQTEIKFRRKNFGTWGNWVTISQDRVTEITQEVSKDTYNNTYNINTYPTITTDSNGWLQAVDTNTADETGKTNMTGAIMSMLTSTGYCHLSPGIFYVSGGIDLPTGATLEGCGRDTIIRLIGSVESGYIARLKEYSTIKNIRFSGGYADGDVSNGNIGGRKGIIYIGNRNGQEPSVTPSTGKNCHITNCWFENLDSGIYGHNAGGGLQEGLTVSDCYITLCKAGINLDYWTEYCKFTNVVVFKCYYACINNGGNNVFTACTFHGTIGFLIDNTNNKSPNNAHGSCVGCTFNHIDNWNYPETLGGGYGVQILNSLEGFIFTGCQFFFGKILIQSSKGFAFSDSLFKGTDTGEIIVTGNYPVFFSNNIFQNAPVLSVNGNSKFDNCYLAADGSLITV